MTDTTSALFPGVKISALPTTTSLDGTEPVPLVKDGVTRTATTAQIGGLSGSTAINWRGAVDVNLAGGQTDDWSVDLTDISRIRANLAGDATVTGLIPPADPDEAEGRIMFV